MDPKDCSLQQFLQEHMKDVQIISTSGGTLEKFGHSAQSAAFTELLQLRSRNAFKKDEIGAVLVTYFGLLGYSVEVTEHPRAHAEMENALMEAIGEMDELSAPQALPHSQTIKATQDDMLILVMVSHNDTFAVVHQFPPVPLDRTL